MPEEKRKDIFDQYDIRGTKISSDRILYDLSDSNIKCPVFFNEASKLWVKHLVIFATPTHSIDFMQEYNPMGMAYIVDVFARAIISFGIYQTVASFRKFGKW